MLYPVFVFMPMASFFGKGELPASMRLPVVLRAKTEEEAKEEARGLGSGAIFEYRLSLS